LKKTLQDKQPERRYAAAYVIGEKKVPLPQELIELLSDGNADVQQMARRSLILLACQANSQTIPNDKPSSTLRTQVNKLVKFGPNPTAKKKGIQTASQKWTDWWEQNDPDLEKLKVTRSSGVKSASKK
jgi:hypothetical protein